MTPAEPPRIARQERVALALGAGGARGLAQIGVLEALDARGFRIVSIAGSSCGALVGGLFAAGKLGAYRDWLFGMSRTDMLRLLDPGLGRASLFHGTRLMQALRELAGTPRIEELPIDFTAVAVDVLRQREVWLREGDLWDAVRASFAIPGLFTPWIVHGRELVDGGLLAPLPIAATRLSDAHRLIAVDMHGWPQRPPGAPAQHEDDTEATRQSLTTRAAAWLEHRFGTDGDDDARVEAERRNRIGFTELLARSLDTMQAQIARVQLALDSRSEGRAGEGCFSPAVAAGQRQQQPPPGLPLPAVRARGGARHTSRRNRGCDRWVIRSHQAGTPRSLPGFRISNSSAPRLRQRSMNPAAEAGSVR